MLRKRGLVLVLIAAVLLLSLAGCFGGGASSPYRGRYPYDAAAVSEVSFVWADPDGTVVRLETLEPEQYDSFFQSFSQLKRHEYWNDPFDYVQGSAILITLQDGDYHLINNYCTIRCIDGKAEDTLEYYGHEEFGDFWRQYCSREYILP